jgi:hypothetical protein
MDRSRGLVKRWEDRFGNLLIDEFSPYTLAVQIYNENAPEPGRERYILLYYISYITENIRCVWVRYAFVFSCPTYFHL